MWDGAVKSWSVQVHLISRSKTRRGKFCLRLGERADRPLASRLAGSLRLVDGPDGLAFAIDQLPEHFVCQGF